MQSAKAERGELGQGRTPLWMLFPGAFALVALTHYTLLRLPYYWDEAGYYIPAAWDFFRTGSLVPTSSTPNSHPPLPSILLAGWWHVVGFSPAATRLLMCMVAAAALLGVYRLARVMLPANPARNAVALATAALTGLYPIWFAQSTLAHADLFAAAATLWALSFYFERGVENGELGSGRPWQRIWVFVLFSVAAMAKETSVATPFTLALLEFYWLARKKGAVTRRIRFGWMEALVVPALPLLGWYAYLKHRTGNFFGDPAYVQYNATTTMDPTRLLMAIANRAMHLTTHMELFVPVACMLGAMLLPALLERDGAERERIALPLQAVLGIVLLANLLEFSFLGGALLTRYLLPMYPLILLECVATWRRRVRAWWLIVALTAAAFIAGIFINPPYGFSPEDNLEYSNFIRLQQHAVAEVVAMHPRAVMTAWPASDELRKPELGYVVRTVPVVTVENFSDAAVQQFLASQQSFDSVLIFSTKYEPQSLWTRLGLTGLGRANEGMNARYFGFHHDLTPEQAAAELGATVVWREESGGMWAAVLRVNPTQDAMNSFATKTR